MSKRLFVLAHDQARARAVQSIQNAPQGYIVTIAEPTRNLDQNAAQWPILNAFADQLVWPVNGEMVQISAEDWKDLLTSAFRREQPRVAMGIDGGMVLLGQRTSKFKKGEFSDWLDFLNATAADRGVALDERQAA
jgi:hypothetical protein